MKKILHLGLFLLIFQAILLIACQGAKAETSDANNLQTNDVYFLAVGSEHYLPSRPPKWTGFENRGAPVHSAERVAKLLQEHGAKQGILLISDEKRLISRTDMRRAITDLKKLIRQDNSQNPVIFFYFMGHGLGDKFATDLCMVPGNILLSKGGKTQSQRLKIMKSMLCADTDLIPSFVMFRTHKSMAHWDDILMTDIEPDPTSIEDTKKVMKTQNELESIDNYNREHGLYPPNGNPDVPFIAMFDNCYGGIIPDIVRIDENGQASITGINGMLSEIISGVNDYMTNYIQQTKAEIENGGLVLYATKPGEEIGDFPDPDPDEKLRVGSLARRFIQGLRSAEKTKPITIKDLREKMKDISVDNQTLTLYSISDTKANILETVLFSGHTPKSKDNIEIRYGTANEPSYCCGIDIK